MLYPADRELKDFIVGRGGIEFTHENEGYKLDETKKICGRDTGLWCFIIEKHGTAYKKTKNLQPVMDVVDVYDYFRKEDEGVDEVYETSTTDAEYNRSMANEYHYDEFFKHKYINSNKLHKIDEIVKEGDVVEVLDCYDWKGTHLLKCRMQVQQVDG